MIQIQWNNLKGTFVELKKKRKSIQIKARNVGNLDGCTVGHLHGNFCKREHYALNCQDFLFHNAPSARG